MNVHQERHGSKVPRVSSVLSHPGRFVVRLCYVHSGFENKKVPTWLCATIAYSSQVISDRSTTASASGLMSQTFKPAAGLDHPHNLVNAVLTSGENRSAASIIQHSKIK